MGGNIQAGLLRIQKGILVTGVVFCALFFVLCRQSVSVPIDLNDFYMDTSVTVAADGSSAVMTEDASIFSALLSNDPGMGNPGVLIPPNFSGIPLVWNSNSMPIWKTITLQA